MPKDGRYLLIEFSLRDALEEIPRESLKTRGSMMSTQGNSFVVFQDYLIVFISCPSTIDWFGHRIFYDIDIKQRTD